MKTYNLNLIISTVSLLGTILTNGVVVSSNVEFCDKSSTLIGPQLVLTVSNSNNLRDLNIGAKMQEQNKIKQIFPLSTKRMERTTIQATLASKVIKLVVLDKPVCDILPAEVKRTHEIKEHFYTSNEDMTFINSLKDKTLSQPQKYITKDTYNLLYFQFPDDETPISGRGILKQKNKELNQDTSFVLSGVLCVDSIEYNQDFNKFHYINSKDRNLNDAITHAAIVKSLYEKKASIGIVYELTKEDVEYIHYLNLKIALQDA